MQNIFLPVVILFVIVDLLLFIFCFGCCCFCCCYCCFLFVVCVQPVVFVFVFVLPVVLALFLFNILSLLLLLLLVTYQLLFWVGCFGFVFCSFCLCFASDTLPPKNIFLQFQRFLSVSLPKPHFLKIRLLHFVLFVPLVLFFWLCFLHFTLIFFFFVSLIPLLITNSVFHFCGFGQFLFPFVFDVSSVLFWCCLFLLVVLKTKFVLFFLKV